MKTIILAAIHCFLMFLVPSVTYAISAQWDLDPISGDWNTAANWTPMGVPNGPSDTATFGLSDTTDVSMSANTEVNGITFTPLATNPYTITASPGLTLTISGSGVTNNSGRTQEFVTGVDGTGNFGQIVFRNSATAGNSTSFTNNAGSTKGGAFGGQTYFFNSSTAGNGTFINNGGAVGGSGAVGGFTALLDNSTAGNGTFINNGALAVGSTGGATFVYGTAGAANATFINNGGTVSGAQSGFTAVAYTAGSATFINNGGTVSGSGGGETQFVGISTAANSIVFNNGGTVYATRGGVTFFSSHTTAGNATIINNGGAVSGAGGGETFFSGMLSYGIATAGNATLIARGGVNGGAGGAIVFLGDSAGGTSRVEVFGNGNLDISTHDAPGVTIGSIEGNGDAFLGANNLTVGNNNLSTTFSGVIQDGGSLTKIGNGTLDLTGANTYTGDTNINAGVLKVGGSITSNTFVRRGSTLAGTGTINGNVVTYNHSTLASTGTINGNVVANNRSMIASTGTINGNVMNNDSGTLRPGGGLGAPGVLTVVHNYTQAEFATLMIQIAGMSSDQFSVLNVLGNANLNGFLDPVLSNGFVPTIGQTFTFLNYASLTGEFSHIKHQVFDNGLLQWSVTYEANHAILTVEQHTPDQGSTLLLLALGLLGLVTCRRQLLRGQT
jgi:hypothetical protein